MRLTSLALLAALASCTSVRQSFDFRPSPAEVVVADVARVLVDIPGATREDEQRDGVPLMEVRLRLESRSDEPLVLAPARCTLIGSDLRTFGAPRGAAERVELAPHSTASLSLWFPFPDGVPLSAPAVDGVVFGFWLTGARLEYESSATFERVWPDLRPGWRSSFGFGFGYTSIGCH